MNDRDGEWVPFRAAESWPRKVRRLRFLALLLGLWAGWSLAPELVLWWKTADWERLRAFDQVQIHPPQAQVPDMIAFRQRYDILPGCPVDAYVSWSMGTKTYAYCRMRAGERTIFDFWATHSTTDRPRMWIERDVIPPRILTYQPWAFPGQTPLGNVRPGYLLWRYNGEQYVPAEKLYVCPAMMWLRNPVPFQD